MNIKSDKDRVIQSLLPRLEKLGLTNKPDDCTANTTPSTKECRFTDKLCYKMSPFLKVTIFNTDCNVFIINTLYKDKNTASFTTIERRDVIYDTTYKNVNDMLTDDYKFNRVFNVNKVLSYSWKRYFLPKKTIDEDKDQVDTQLAYSLYPLNDSSSNTSNKYKDSDNFTSLSSSQKELQRIINDGSKDENVKKFCSQYTGHVGGYKKSKETITIKGKKYKIHVGPKGGKYIMRNGKLCNIKRYIKN